MTIASLAVRAIMAICETPATPEPAIPAKVTEAQLDLDEAKRRRDTRAEHAAYLRAREVRHAGLRREILARRFKEMTQ